MTTPDVNLIDLTWVQFSEEEADPCEVLEGCSLEATWVAKFNWNCGCLPETRYYCESHGSFLKSFWKLNSVCSCTQCGTLVYLQSMERKTK